MGQNSLLGSRDFYRETPFTESTWLVCRHPADVPLRFRRIDQRNRLATASPVHAKISKIRRNQPDVSCPRSLSPAGEPLARGEVRSGDSARQVASANFFQGHDPAFVGGPNSAINGRECRFILFLEDWRRFIEVQLLHLSHAFTVARISGECKSRILEW
jgi:hypothetical protein